MGDSPGLTRAEGLCMAFREQPRVLCWAWGTRCQSQAAGEAECQEVPWGSSCVTCGPGYSGG